MSESIQSQRCGKCGAPLSGYAPNGLCAACLLECAFEVESPLIPSRSPTGGENGVSPSAGDIPLTPPPTTTLPRPDEESPGSVIGRYKLLEKIGEGGFGVVYVAEQREPVKRRVALKIIKLGMDTRQVVARFEAERQALAMMDHANIAKVFDAGATDAGRPYFVMELVRGLKITDYCDQHNLPARERLNLFIQVCQAIQHAHQKGIIHRDIKPSNVLVTVNDGVPVPKVIDFGIAKATQGELTDKTVYTHFQQFIGTPAYMSPEQAEMTSLDIDTRSDIYALGVLLYELLTGKTPFEQTDLLKAGLDGMRRMIREQEPLRPSTRVSSLHEAERTTTAKRRGLDPPKLVSLLRGDLDWIVMKCLEKDRTRRYETANGVAMDVRRYLCDEPVLACPPSAAYRFQKLVRRNKALAVYGTVILALLLVVAIGSTIGVYRINRERQQAVEKEIQAQKEAAKSLAAFKIMAGMLESVNPAAARGRDTELLRTILDDTAKRVVADLKDQPLVEANLRILLGKTYAAIGLWTNGMEMTQEALRLRRLHLGPTNEDVAIALNNLGTMFYDANDYENAVRCAREALVIRTNVHGLWHSNVATSLNNMGLALWNLGKYRDSLEAAQQALVIRRKLQPDDPFNLGMSAINIAILQFSLADFSSAETNLLAALAYFRRAEHPVAAAVVEANLALVSAKRGDLTAARDLNERVLADRRKLFKADNRDTEISLTQLGIVQVAEGDLAAAMRNLNEALAMQRRLGYSRHEHVADALAGLGMVAMKLGQWDEAKTNFQQALLIRLEVFKEDGNADVVDTLDALGLLAVARGDLESAERTLMRAVKGVKSSESPEYPSIIPPLFHLAWVQTERGNPSGAKSSRDEAMAVSQKHGVYGGWPLLKAMIDLAEVLQWEQKFAPAEAVLQQAGDHVQQHFTSDPNLSRITFQKFISLYEAWDRTAPNTGKARQAAEWRKKLEELNQTTNERKP